MDFQKFKHYWIFFITILFYCIGFIIHFVAQSSSNHPHTGRDVLEKVTPNNKIIKNTDSNAIATTINDSKYIKPDNLFYFAQISDIHMSDDYSKGSQGHLYYFLNKLIPIIDPNFLFITGDISNSKRYGGIKVGTEEQEWQMYHKILEKTGVLNKNNGTFLWDLRGNHDCFLVPEWSSPYNYFKEYSKTKTRGFSFRYETSYGTYSFIGLDGCPIFTPANPFFGFIDEVSMNSYSKFMDNAKADPQNKHNFVFMHFPETTAKFGKSTSGKHWEDYTKNISLLLTGHFHNLVGDQIYAYHHDYLEMELNDLKLHGKYRIVSIDNDVISISDNALPLPELPYDFKTSKIDNLISRPPQVFNQDIPPIVHITSPKNSHFIIETNREPVKESLDSEYVRVLVFSKQSPNDLTISLYIDSKVQSVEFKYVGNQNLQKRFSDKIHIYSREEDTKENGNQSQNQSITTSEEQIVDYKTPPLWIAKWDSSNYNDGKSHELKVVAYDKKNNLKGENIISFRLDGKKDGLGIPFIGQFLLKTVFAKSLPIIFGIVYILYELMILLPRLYAVRHIIPNHSDIPFLPKEYIGDIIFNETKRFHESFFKKHFILPFIEAFTFNGIFYPLQILVICILVLPSKIGLFSRSSEHFSRFCGEFLYGFYGSGQWANTLDQYGIFMAIFLLVPFVATLIIVFINHRRERNYIITYILLFIVFILQLLLSIGSSYMRGGILTVFLSPFPVWIFIYSWFIIFIIIKRRFKNRNNKPVTPELIPLQI